MYIVIKYKAFESLLLLLGGFVLSFQNAGASALVIRNDSLLPAQEMRIDTLISLQEVEIEAKYMERRDDGTLDVRVHGNPLATGQQIETFLNYIPDVIVQGDEVSVGSSKSVVYELDGRIINWDELKNLPLEMISRLEVVRHGGIKYGKDQAVLRVVLRRVPGLLGTLRYDHGVYSYGSDLFSPSNTMLLRAGSHTLYSNLSFRHMDDLTKLFHTDYYEDHTEDIRQSSRYKQNRLNESLSYQYEWTEATRLQVYGALSLSHKDNDDYSFGPSYLNTLQKERYKGYSAGVKLFHAFGGMAGSRLHELEMTLGYYGRDISTDNNYVSTTPHTAGSREIQNNLNLDVFTRFSLPGNQKLSFRFNCYGGPNHYSYAGITDPVLSALARQDYTESNFSQVVSASYNATWGDVFLNVNTGYYHIPFKHTDHQDPAGNFKRTSGGFSNNIFMRWNMDKQRGRALEVSFHQSFSIPNFYYFTPAVSYDTPTLYRTGNQHLEDEKRHSLELNYHLNDHTSLNATVNYQHNLVQVIMHEDADRPGVHFTRPENIGRSWVYNLSFNHGGYVIPRVWYMSHSLYLQYTYQGMGAQRLYAPFAALYSNHNWQVSSTLRLMLSITANPRMKTINGEFDGTVNLSPGASLSLFHDCLNVNLTANNLFGNRRKMTCYGNDFHFRVTPITHPDYLTLTLTWNFHAGRKIQQTRLTEVNASGTGLTIPGI